MSYKYNTRQRKKSIQGLRSFKVSLPKNIREKILKKADIYSKIINNWKQIVGNDLFKACVPKSFKNFKTAKIKQLNLMVKRGHEVDVEYSKKSIINKMNSFFGYNVVEKIKLTSFEREHDKIKENNNADVTKNQHIDKILTIKNDKIKNSLFELSKLYKKK